MARVKIYFLVVFFFVLQAIDLLAVICTMRAFVAHGPSVLYRQAYRLGVGRPKLEVNGE